MRIWFFLLVMTICLFGVAVAGTPPAVNILGFELHQLLVLSARSGGDENPWIDGEPWNDDRPRNGQNVADKSKGSGGDEHGWTERTGQGVLDKSGSGGRPWIEGPPRNGQSSAGKSDGGGSGEHPWTGPPGHGAGN